MTPEPPRATQGRPTQQQGYRVYTSPYTTNTGTTGSFEFGFADFVRAAQEAAASNVRSGPCPGCGHTANNHVGGMCYGFDEAFLKNWEPCDCRWRVGQGWARPS